MEAPAEPNSEGSQEPRGCGVGQVGWRHHLEDPSEAREHGVGEVSGQPELALRSNGTLSPGLEARELGVGETSCPESPCRENCLPAAEPLPEDMGMEPEDTSSFTASPGGCLARCPPPGSQDLLEDTLVASRLRGLSEEEDEAATRAGAVPAESPLPSWRPQPDGEASRTEEVDGTWVPSGTGLGQQGPTRPPRRPCQGPSSALSQDFSFIQDTEVLDSAMFRSRANLGRKRGHRAPAIRPGGTLGLSEAADSDARLFQDSTEPRASRAPSSDEEVVEEPQNRRTRMSLGTKGLKVNLFPGLSPSALKAKLRPRNRSAEEGEPAEGKPHPKESAVQRSKSCKVPGLGKPLALPPKPEKPSGSEGSSPNWLQALKLKKKKV